MSIIVDDNKYRLSSKNPVDNLRLTWHARDNRVSLLNCMAILTATNMIIRIEYQKHRDTIASMLLRLIKIYYFLRAMNYPWCF